MTTATIEPGIMYGVPEAEYRAWPYQSASALADLADDKIVSPKQWKWDQDHPKEPTPAMRKGSALHMMILEPARFNDTYAIGGPINEKTGKPYGDESKAFREWADAQGDKPYLTLKEFAEVCGMTEAVRDCPKAQPFITGGRAEVSGVWDYPVRPDVMIRLKFRPDCVVNGGRILVNIKTTATPQPDLFVKRSVIEYGYNTATALYADAWEAATGEKPETVWIIVQNEPPFDVVVRPAGPTVYETGRFLYQRAIETFYVCTKRGEWPGWDTPDDMTPMELPSWYCQQIMQNR